MHYVPWVLRAVRFSIILRLKAGLAALDLIFSVDGKTENSRNPTMLSDTPLLQCTIKRLSGSQSTQNRNPESTTRTHAPQQISTHAKGSRAAVYEASLISMLAPKQPLGPCHPQKAPWFVIGDSSLATICLRCQQRPIQRGTLLKAFVEELLQEGSAGPNLQEAAQSQPPLWHVPRPQCLPQMHLLLEHYVQGGCPQFKTDADRLEGIWRRNKNIKGFGNLPYSRRLGEHNLPNLPTTEPRGMWLQCANTYTEVDSDHQLVGLADQGIT